MPQVEDMLGKTLSNVEVGKEKIVFTCDDGKRFKMYHSQECEESVTVEDVVGEMQDLIGQPLLMSEEVKHVGRNPECTPAKGCQESFTWTFYKFATIKGYVTIRWYGYSNGYYSESVDFVEVS
jgi:hypothetical protein